MLWHVRTGPVPFYPNFVRTRQAMTMCLLLRGFVRLRETARKTVAVEIDPHVFLFLLSSQSHAASFGTQWLPGGKEDLAMHVMSYV